MAPEFESLAVEWFARRAWKPFPFQHEAWRVYKNGESGLIHAATGTGKSYAALFGPLMDSANQNPSSTKASGLNLLWITPLRALAADTEQSLALPIHELKLPWTIGRRTGDTSASQRQKQKERLPSLLITTPESLSLLLSSPDAPEKFRYLQAVVVDEWHELMGSKRGVMTELCLARLRQWQPRLRTWGLSATIGNLTTALECLIGNNATGRLIEGAAAKRTLVESLIPDSIERFPWAGHLGLKMLTPVVNAIERAQSTLVFTNTRSQAETWYQALLEARPDWAGAMAIHHSSLDRKAREWVEDAVRTGKLRCVVCTSSLDLGVDFSPVDQAIQIGSPKGVARLLQRAGRSGHQPGAESRLTCVPTHAFELIEFAAARRAMAARHIEARVPILKPLDLLAQHLVTIGCGTGFDAEAMFDEVRTTFAYRTLTREEWQWTLDFVSNGGQALQAYEQYRKLSNDGGYYRISDAAIAKRHRLMIGTITSDASLQVKYLNGELLGTIEENFVSRLSKGDTFIFAGRVLEFVRLREMTVQVRRAKDSQGAMPRWFGGRIPLSSELAEAVLETLGAGQTGDPNSPEMAAVQPILELQARWSRVPQRGELLIEQLATREGHHLFFYPFAGKLANDGLAALVALRLSRLQPITFTIATNDYGFELLSPDPSQIVFDEPLARRLLSLENLNDDIASSLNSVEMAKRQFREIARVAGLVFPGYPGQNKTAKQLQMSSGLLYDVFARFEPDHLLLKQARDEVLSRQLDQSRLRATLERLAREPIVICDVSRPTPFAFPLLVDRLREKLSSEKLADRVRRMQMSLEKEAAR